MQGLRVFSGPGSTGGWHEQDRFLGGEDQGRLEATFSGASQEVVRQAVFAGGEHSCTSIAPTLWNMNRGGRAR